MFTGQFLLPAMQCRINFKFQKKKKFDHFSYETECDDIKSDDSVNCGPKLFIFWSF